MDNIPSSVYRFQVSCELTIKKVSALIPYLFELGIEGVYCSPLFDSFSCGGYDVTDPCRFNPALGSSEDFEEFFSQLQKYNMKHLLDIVPNHMGIKGDKNRRWLDVLENGPASAFADFFDIHWTPEMPKLLLPILGEPYEQILEKGQIQLFWKDRFWVRYFDYVLPITHLQGPAKEVLSRFNGRPDLLHDLLEKQFYRLAWWTLAGQKINYRRFEDINALAAIRIEKEEVLEQHHRFIFELLESGKVQGLRVDHPDGLYDPGAYFERVRRKKPAFVWAEKILDFEETLPLEWDVDGSVGYDFLNILNGVFIQKKNEEKITEVYERFIESRMDFHQILYEKRKQYLTLEMSGEIDRLSSGRKRDFAQALLEVFACFPIYRTYVKPGAKIREKDRASISSAVEMAKKKAVGIGPSVFGEIERLLLLDAPFIARFQQLTASAMAKGLEDATFYVYNQLISLNEVGGSPAHFGCSKAEFHAFNSQKLSHWPLGALASSTHDTKYSEDARMRVHALSEIPQEWEALVCKWKKQNQKYKTQVGGLLFPDLNTEYFLYQMLIAVWPADQERLWTCLHKAIREAGIYTSWRKVDERYETAVKKFLEAILEPNEENEFYPAFLQFQQEVANHGFLNSLSALVLKIGSCGIVDLYQGNELMNYALVDPDNRRPVDFSLRKEALKQMDDQKILITSKALNFRRKHKELFLKGDYIPLETPENIIAFMRKWKDQRAIVIAGRFFSEGRMGGHLELPVAGPLQDLLTGKKILPINSSIDLSEALVTYPCALYYL